jgi:4-amino-4-deoxychorismate lyase
MDRTIRHFFRKNFVHDTLKEFLPEPPKGQTLKCVLVYSDSVLSADLHPYSPPQIKTMALVEVENLDFTFKLEDRSELYKIRDFAGTDEIIIIRNGFVTNAATGNLVFEDSEGRFFTPLHYIHAGTKRRFYLKNKTVTSYPIKASGIKSYNRVYLVNAMLDIEDDVGIHTDCLGSLVHYKE